MQEQLIHITSQLAISIIANLTSSKLGNKYSNTKKEQILSIDEILKQINLVDKNQIFFDYDTQTFNVPNAGPNDEYDNIGKGIYNTKSILVTGPQGSGKTTYVKGLINFLNKKNTITEDEIINEDKYKIRGIKTGDYDYDNSPILLFLKKVMNLNILNKENSKKLQLLIGLHNNQTHFNNIPQHIITDTTKHFIKNLEINEQYQNTKVILVLDELERCIPHFALELLEIMTIYTGVECIIDKHSCDGDQTNAKLLINKLQLIGIFDKKILTNSIMNIFGNFNPSKKEVNSFGNKYIEDVLVVLDLNYKELMNHLVEHGILENNNSISKELEYIITKNLNSKLSDGREVKNIIEFTKNNINDLDSIKIDPFFKKFYLGKILGNFNVYKLKNLKMNPLDFEKLNNLFNSNSHYDVADVINNIKTYIEHFSFKRIAGYYSDEYKIIEDKIKNVE